MFVFSSQLLQSWLFGSPCHDTKSCEDNPNFTMARYNAFDKTAIALSAVFLPLAVVAVALRIVARRRTKANVGLDDLLAEFALAVYVCFTAMVLWGMWSCLNASQGGLLKR